MADLPAVPVDSAALDAFKVCFRQEAKGSELSLNAPDTFTIVRHTIRFSLQSPANRKKKAALEPPRRFGAQPVAAALQEAATYANFARMDHLL